MFYSLNTATFKQQSIGVKLGGPIAAYTALLLMMRCTLSRIFKGLREEGIHRQKLLFNDLSNQETICRSELFARLVADFCLMDLIELRTWRFSDHVC